MVEINKNNKRPFNSKRVERGERGGWITITKSKKAQSFERKERGERGGGGGFQSPL